MARDQNDRHPDGRPVLSGLAALLVAAVGIGIVLAAGLVVVTRVLDTGGAEDAEGTPSSGQTLVIPSVPPEEADGEVPDPPFTDTPRPTLGSQEPSGSPTEELGSYTLTTTSDQVAPGERLDLSGTYAGGEGAVLEVEQLVGDTWQPFEVQATVRGSTYATYIFTEQVGDNTYRMTDPATGESSNEVEVTIGG